MSDSEVSPAGGESIPSPELFKLTLAELTEENKEKSAKTKAEANKAFVGTFSSGRLSTRCQESLHLTSSLLSGSADTDISVVFLDTFVLQLMSLGRPRISTHKLWISIHSMLRCGVIGHMRGSS